MNTMRYEVRPDSDEAVKHRIDEYNREQRLKETKAWLKLLLAIAFLLFTPCLWLFAYMMDPGTPGNGWVFMQGICVLAQIIFMVLAFVDLYKGLSNDYDAEDSFSFIFVRWVLRKLVPPL